MLDRKGQESAPFELLIAVIIMGFVIFVGLEAMRQLSMQKCKGETEAKLEELKTKLEITVTQKSPQDISFFPSSCISEEKETITIKEEGEPLVCANYCGSAKNLCTLLTYTYTGDGGFSIIKCLNISPETVFQTTSTGGGRCPDKSSEKLELVDLRRGMPRGNYHLLNKSRVTDTFPTICAYRSVK